MLNNFALFAIWFVVGFAIIWVISEIIKIK